MHRLKQHYPVPLVSSRFLLRLSRIKHSQVISMGKFGPTALSFGKDFFSVSYFILGHAVLGPINGRAEKVDTTSRVPRHFCLPGTFSWV